MTVHGAINVCVPCSCWTPAGCNSTSSSPGAATAASVPSNGRYAKTGPENSAILARISEAAAHRAVIGPTENMSLLRAHNLKVTDGKPRLQLACGFSQAQPEI